MTRMNQRGDWNGDISFAGIQLGLMAAVLIVGYQAYGYLKHGTWIELSTIDGLLYLSSNKPSPWLLYPYDWVGLHKLLEKTPLALSAVIIGILWTVVFGFLCAKLEKYQKRKRREAQEKSRRQDDLQ
jgi:hypothetical protein